MCVEGTLNRSQAEASRHLYFNRAIHRLIDQLALGTASPLLALISCIIFVCIEIIRDHVFGPLMLLKKGIPLLRQLLVQPDGIQTSAFEVIKGFFMRLRVSCAVFGHCDV